MEIKQISKKLLVSILLFLMIFVSISNPVFAKKDEPDNYGMAGMAAAARQKFTDLLNSNKDTDDQMKFTNGGSKPMFQRAGGVMGFLRKGLISGGYGQDMGLKSISIAYKAPTSATVQQYLYYGKALDSVGLTGFSMGIFGVFRNIGRAITGMIMIIVYTGVVIVDAFISYVLKMLVLLNPFAFFVNSEAKDGALNSQFSNFMRNKVYGDNISDTLDTMRKPFGALFEAVQKFGVFFTIPMSIALLIAGMLLFRRNTNDGDKIKKVILRCIFILAGIPILGILYTSTLSGVYHSLMNGDNSVGIKYMNTGIAMSYIDVKNWALNSNFALPNGLNLNIDTNTFKTRSNWDLNKLAFNVNKLGKSPITNNLNTDENTSLEIKYDRFVENKAQANEVSDDQIGGNKKPNSYGAGYDLLWDYVRSVKITPSAYEAQYIKKLGKDGNERYRAEAKQFSDSGIYFKDGKTSENNWEQPFAGHEGTQKVREHKATAAFFRDNSHDNYSSWSGDSIGYSGKGGEKGLSTMSTYNFLSTKFGDKATAYDPTEDGGYYSVKLVGKGMESAMLYIKTLSYLSCVAVIGIFIIIPIFFNTLKRFFRVLTQIPLVIIGSLRGIVSVIIVSFMTIFDILISFFMYEFGLQAISKFSGLFLTLKVFEPSSTPFIQTPLTGTENEAAQQAVTHAITQSQSLVDIGGSIGFVVNCLIVVIFNFGIIFAVLKARSALLKATDQMLTEFVQKFFNAAPNPEMPKNDKQNNKNESKDGQSVKPGSEEGPRSDSELQKAEGEPEGGEEAEDGDSGGIENEDDQFGNNTETEVESSSGGEGSSGGKVIAGAGAGVTNKSVSGGSVGANKLTPKQVKDTAYKAIDGMNLPPEEAKQLKDMADGYIAAAGDDIKTLGGLKEFNSKLADAGVNISESDYLKPAELGKQLAESGVTTLGDVEVPEVTGEAVQSTVSNKVSGSASNNVRPTIPVSKGGSKRVNSKVKVNKGTGVNVTPKMPGKLNQFAQKTIDVAVDMDQRLQADAIIGGVYTAGREVVKGTANVTVKAAKATGNAVKAAPGKVKDFAVKVDKKVESVPVAGVVYKGGKATTKFTAKHTFNAAKYAATDVYNLTKSAGEAVADYTKKEFNSAFMGKKSGSLDNAISSVKKAGSRNFKDGSHVANAIKRDTVGKVANAFKKKEKVQKKKQINKKDLINGKELETF